MLGKPGAEGAIDGRGGIDLFGAGMGMAVFEGPDRPSEKKGAWGVKEFTFDMLDTVQP